MRAQALLGIYTQSMPNKLEDVTEILVSCLFNCEGPSADEAWDLGQLPRMLRAFPELCSRWS